jgi:hypothetical protein
VPSFAWYTPRGDLLFEFIESPAASRKALLARFVLPDRDSPPFDSGEDLRVVSTFTQSCGRPTARIVWSMPKSPWAVREHVLHYLSRYTHRVAISNHRLVSLEDGKVTFLWEDGAPIHDLATNGQHRFVSTELHASGGRVIAISSWTAPMIALITSGRSPRWPLRCLSTARASHHKKTSKWAGNHFPAESHPQAKLKNVRSCAHGASA